MRDRAMQRPSSTKLGKAGLVGATLAVAVFLVVVLSTHRFMRTPLASPAMLVTVTQRNKHFYPDRITLARGAMVHILNQDDVTHHVYVKSPDMNFESGDDPIGTSVNVEFDHPGTYDVQCAIHPLMHLWVIVK